MKNLKLVELLRSQQEETFNEPAETNQERRTMLINEIIRCESALYGLGEEKHLKSVMLPAERFETLSTATDLRLKESIILYHVRINKLINEQQKRIQALIGAETYKFKPDYSKLKNDAVLTPLG